MDLPPLQLIPEKKYTVPEIAYIVEVGEDTVRDWLRKGHLKGENPKHIWRVTGVDLKEFLERRYGVAK